MGPPDPGRQRSKAATESRPVSETAFDGHPRLENILPLRTFQKLNGIDAMRTLVMISQASAAPSGSQKLIALLSRQVVEITDVILAVSQQAAAPLKLRN